MKIKNKITALLTVFLILLTQVPFSAFAAGTDIRAELLSPDTLPDGRVEVFYKVDFWFDYTKFDNGYQWYSWSIDGELPPGLELGAQHSTWEPVLRGTPTKAGNYTFTIKGGRTDYINGENVPVVAAIKTYTLTILPEYPLKIDKDSLYNGKEGESYWNKVYEDRNRAVTWSMELAEGGTLPKGLSINTENGEMTWENPIAGKYNLKITATRNGESVSKVLKLIIESEGGCKHTGAIKTTRKAATCKENGLADYWYCDDCEGYFLDAEGTRATSADRLDKLYTVGFHSDKNDDGKCDTCDKNMPIFKKVTNEDEITSRGMYLVVSKIGDKYYALKAPKENYTESIEAIEITQNSDGTFSYFEPDTGVMMLKTEFTAECGEIDAGLPRYSLETTINNIPYCLSSDDYSGAVYMDAYRNSKYGFRIALPDGGTPAIASVYTEYWSGETGKGESNCGILTAFEAAKDDTIKRFFSLRTKESYESTGIDMNDGTCYFYDTLSSYPIELYKLTYAGETNGKSYTVSDAQSLVTIDNRFECVASAEENALSTVGGISEALKIDYVEDVVMGQITADDTISVKTYANINLTHEVSSEDEYGMSNIEQLSYEVIPQLEIKANNTGTSVVNKIDDKYFDGSKMTLSLCVGNMEPTQIIHYKEDGTKEYFYSEYSEQAQNGSKSFKMVRNPRTGEGFVQFDVTSFSVIKILSNAETENQSNVYAAEIEDIYLQLPVGYNQNHIWELGSNGFRRNIDIKNIGNQMLYMESPTLVNITPATDKIYISFGSVPNILLTGNTVTNYYVDLDKELEAGQYTATIQFMDSLNQLPQPVTANLTVVVGNVGIKKAYQSGTKAKAEVAVLEAGEYTVLFVDYESGKLNAAECKSLTVSADNTGIQTIESDGNITIGKGDKVMVLENLQTMKPLCVSYIVKAE